MNVRRLSNNYWDRFIKTDPKNGRAVRDGLKFEDLVEELLKYSFPYGEWHRTKKSHDNNRDFYLTNSMNRIWAECKNFTESISLKIIAPTLIMARIYSVNCILFFSYSPINKNTREKLSLYAEKTNSEIRLFDGSLLDGLILDAQNALSKRFKPDSGDIINDCYQRDIGTSFYIARDIHFYSATDDEIIHAYESIDALDRFSPFEVVICVDVPDNRGEAKVVVTIPQTEGNSWFINLHPTMLNDESLIVTTVSQNICIRIPLKPILSAESVALPQIIVRVWCNGVNESFFSPNILTRLQWNNEIELTGNDYRKCIQDFSDLLIGRSCFSCFALYGKSGVGKTRLLRELRDQLIVKGYRIISFIGTASEDITIMLREIIAFLYDIPSVEITTIIEEEILSETEYDSEYMRAYRIMRRISSAHGISFYDVDLLDVLTNLIAEKAAEQKIAIVIDDFQKYGDIAVAFFSRIIEYASTMQRSNQSILLFSYNNDYENERMIDLMTHVFKAQKDNICFVTKEINGFNTGEAESFVRNLLSAKDERFSPQLRMIVSRYNNPHMIKTVIRQLISSSCIELKEKEVISIPRLDIFKQTLEDLPIDMSNLMISRYYSFMNRYNANETDVLSILSLISLLSRVSRKDVSYFSLDERILDQLCDESILSESFDGKLSFFHNQFEKACILHKGDDYFRIISKLASKKLLDRAKPYPMLHAMCSIRIGIMSWQMVREWSTFLMSTRPREVCGKYIYTNTIVYILKEITDKNHGSEAISLAMTMCYNYRNNYGYEESIQLFDMVYKHILILGYEVLYQHCDFRVFVDTYSDTMRTVSKTTEALCFLQEVRSSVLLLPNDDNKNATLAMVYNREMIVYRDYDLDSNYEAKVLSLYKKSMSYAMKINDYSLREEMIYLNESDLGYLYYTYQQNYSTLISLWDRCLKHDITQISSKTLNIYRKMAQLCLIKGNINGARSAANLMREYLANNERDRNDLIFTVFIKKLDATCCLLERDNMDYAEVGRIIDEAMATDMLRNPMKIYDSFTLKGIYFYYCGDYDSALGCFNEAFELIRTVPYTLNRKAKINLIQQNIAQCKSIASGTKDIDTNLANGILRTNDGLLNLPLLV